MNLWRCTNHQAANTVAWQELNSMMWATQDAMKPSQCTLSLPCQRQLGIEPDAFSALCSQTRSTTGVHDSWPEWSRLFQKSLVPFNATYHAMRLKDTGLKNVARRKKAGTVWCTGVHDSWLMTRLIPNFVNNPWSYLMQHVMRLKDTRFKNVAGRKKLEPYDLLEFMMDDSWPEWSSTFPRIPSPISRNM